MLVILIGRLGIGLSREDMLWEMITFCFKRCANGLEI